MPYIKREDVLELKSAGSFMSNWLHNMSQHHEIPDHLKPQMKTMVEVWDKANRKIKQRNKKPNVHSF